MIAAPAFMEPPWTSMHLPLYLWTRRFWPLAYAGAGNPIIATVTGFLWLPTLYYVYAVNEREHVRSMATATLIGALLFGVLYVQFPEFFTEFNKN